MLHVTTKLTRLEEDFLESNLIEDNEPHVMARVYASSSTEPMNEAKASSEPQQYLQPYMASSTVPTPSSLPLGETGIVSV
jgi:hypothetical protein